MTRPPAEAPRPERESLRRRLRTWYRARRRQLPWRETTDPYAIWVAETMLQQTRVETVLGYYEPFLRRFPTVEALARAREPTVLAAWSGLGYYRRARSLRRAAREVVHRHGGRVPRSARDLARLPGIGRYTASAVSSIAFGEPTPVVDGNVARVLARLFGLDAPDAGDPAAELPWSVARRLVPRYRPGEWNQALMELGATVCTPGRPSCGRCPVRRHCRAFRAGRAERIPLARARPRTVPVRRAVAIVELDGTFLVRRNDGKRLLGGLWEFPGTEVSPGEDPRRALRRELRRTGVRGGRLTHRETIRHAITRYRIDSEVYQLTGGRLHGARRNGTGSIRGRWVTLPRLARLPLSAVGLQIRTRLRRRRCS